MKMFLVFMFMVWGFFAQADTSIVIGENDWLPVTLLEETSQEFKLSKLAGKVYSGNAECSGFEYEGKYFTAKHCVEENGGEGKFCVGKKCVDVTYNYAPFGADLAYSKRVLAPTTVKFKAYLLHFQDGELMISMNCELWSVSPTRVYHLCDSYFGSSGGLLVRVSVDPVTGLEVHTPWAVHTGGIPSIPANTAVKLSVLDDL
jgi:hypothetical protein